MLSEYPSAGRRHNAMQGNLFALLDKSSKPKAAKGEKKKKAPVVGAEEKAAEKASTKELEKAIFAQPLTSSNWADTDDEEDAADMEGGRTVEEDDGWSRVPVRLA